MRALLLASPAVTALVGNNITADRIAQSTNRPFVVFVRTGTERDVGLDGTVHAVKASFSVQVWADTRASARAVADAMVATFESAQRIVLDDASDSDPDLDMEAITLAVDWWED